MPESGPVDNASVAAAADEMGRDVNPSREIVVSSHTVETHVGEEGEGLEQPEGMGFDEMGRDVIPNREIVESSHKVEPHVGEEGDVLEHPEGTGLSTYNGDGDLEPYEGMQFESEVAAKAFYDDYAHRIGFITRVGSYSRSKVDGAIIGRRFVCNREGFSRGNVKKPEAVTREGCKAMINVRREKTGKWIISKHEKGHNHPLIVSSKVRRGYLLNRSMEDTKKIRELSNKLHRANKQCAVYKEYLNMILGEIEQHTNHISDKVRDIVHSIKKLESQDQQESHHSQQS
ncbi:protein FAR1-RELATED SEQUENCE 5-like isoform X2 [Telopea speciosissima]|uniref:protein FAR1-RELATED SEQUENCE 5-like isoform X2 n=1 Tax=Telopea speciosissima TaxID=54955 RepID=UPI001CC49EC7|nr:protein FAR1-RELATED SEQUENCE 5-like isoform X2 [Telopea speciosissima]